MGPVGSAAWFASAAGAALIIVVSRRIGVARSAAALRIVQGLTVIAMGVLAGPIGVVAAYLGVLHRPRGIEPDAHDAAPSTRWMRAHRTTVLSMNSMVSQPAGAIGAIVLAAIADDWSVSTAMMVGGIVCALAAPLYLPARRAEIRAAAAMPRKRGRHDPSLSDSAALFMVAAGPFLAAREAEHNLLFGITSNLIADEAHGVAAASRGPTSRSPRTRGRVIAVAIMTPPFNIVPLAHR